MAKMSLHQLLRIKKVVFKDGTAEQQQEWNVTYARYLNTNRVINRINNRENADFNFEKYIYMDFSKTRKTHKGFTLAELLVSLLILGEIATFTIPKIISAQQNGTFKSVAKEDFATVGAAYSIYNTSNTPTSSTLINILTPYINYIKVDTSTLLDGGPVGDVASYSCAAGTSTCLKMHNGSMLMLSTNGSFGGTGSTNFVWFLVDPDGIYNGTANSIWGVLYFNGRVTSWANITSGSSNSNGPFTPGNYDPSWFSW